MRGIAQGALPKETVLEKRVEPPGWLGSWSQIALEGEAYRNFGEVTAWRVSLWEGQRLLGERKSFLW